MRRFLVKIEYDGRDFYGWQKQPNRRTVQEEIEKAIEKLTGEIVEVFGSGRTDRGVHALDQAAHFDLKQNIPAKNLPRALNDLLPNDICIRSAKVVPVNFHARFDIKRKTYLYRVHTAKQKRAIYSSRAAHVDYELDIDKMKQAAKILEGKHKFKGFCAADTQVKDFEREIYSIKITKKSNFLNFEVCGNGFLYNMVRIIVGTLIDVGRGKLSDADVQKALETGQRKYAGTTMPPEGLFLKKTEY